MPHTVVDAEVRSQLAAVAEGVGCELLEAEFRGGVLRLILDREEGVGLEHCEAVSKQASALLDVLDFGGGRYLLEVSSPGLDRKLYGPRDYERFTDSEVRVTWKDASMERQRTVLGTLAGFQDGELAVRESASGERLAIAESDLLMIRLEPQL